MTNLETISSLTKTVTLLDQLAEEATELAHAALKASRIMRGENPTPVNIREAESKLVEEWTDLCLVADVMGLNLDEDIYDGKLNRWTARLNEVRNDSKGISSAT
jgi:NTP pyrophosphatase (non-canonical NTP hydrolase)